MNDTPKRQNVVRPLAQIQPPEAPQSAETALPRQMARASFDSVPVPAEELERLKANQQPTKPKRQRTGGRSVPFSTRLRPDTNEYIYAIANGRDVPIAQVLEELVAVHQRQSGAGEGD